MARQLQRVELLQSITARTFPFYFTLRSQDSADAYHDLSVHRRLFEHLLVLLFFAYHHTHVLNHSKLLQPAAETYVIAWTANALKSPRPLASITAREWCIVVTPETSLVYMS